MTSSREIFEEFFYQKQFIYSVELFTFLKFYGYPILDTNFINLINTNFGTIFLLIPLCALLKIVGYNLIYINFFKLLKTFILIYLTIKTVSIFNTNIFFSELLNSVLIAGIWETLMSVLIVLIFLFLIKNIILQNNLLNFIFIPMFLYSLSQIFFLNDFIVLYLILELQFFSIFGLTILMLPQNKLNALFLYLIINILGTIFYLFGLVALYNKTNFFNFNNCLIPVSGFSNFLPLGMLIKLTGITTTVFFQKLYAKRFIQLYGLVLILGEMSLCLINIKLFTKILILKSWSILMVWLLFIIVSIVFSTAAGLRAKTISNIIIYSAVQNGSILLIPQVANHCCGLTVTVIIYLFIYFLTAGLLLKTTQLPNTNFNKYLLFIVLLSLAGVPPLLGFYGKILVLLSLLTNFYYSLFLVLVVSNFISFCFYGKILIQKLATLELRTTLKTKSFQINEKLLKTIFVIFLCFGAIFINQIAAIFISSYKLLISPIFHSASPTKFNTILMYLYFFKF